jgi:AcrR family transcriptional regulator
MPAISIDDNVLPSLAERRRRVSRELMRGEILTAAQHIIRTQGMDALSLRALAKAVGVTAPALYEYFPNKDAILRALFVEGSNVMLSRMDETVKNNAPGVPQVLAVLGGYRRFAREEPDYFRLLFGTVEPALELSEDEYAGLKAIFMRFNGIISNAIELGDLRPLPPETLSCSLGALVHGVALLENDSFMARKDIDGNGEVMHFDAALKLLLLSVATPQGAEAIGPLVNPC